MKFEDMKLSDVCEYSKDRIEVAQIDLNTYISTENLLPGKSGKVRAASLPDAKTTLMYKEGDTLISNIRPYFKKIWYGNCTGGASNDVLIFRPNKEKVYNKYLYYFLSQDKIFDFMVQTSKGTKMPRGDKAALMEYPIKLPPYEIQVSISEFLSKIDEKIKVNKEILNKLEKLADVLFKHWFIDFEFPNAEGRPYKSSGGKMMESDLGEIPKGFRVGTLKDIYENKDSKRVPMSKREREQQEKIYPYYGAASLMDYVGNYLFEGPHLLMGEDGTVKDEEGKPMLQYVWGKFWVNNHAHVMVGKNGFSTEYLYNMLKHIDIEPYITGAVQPKISQRNMNSIKIVIPSDDVRDKAQYTFDSIYKLVRSKKDEVEKLIELRDTLLPKLLSGELELADESEVMLHESV